MTLLTSSETVDVGTLASLFRHTTNSYKHLFFQALLAVLRRQGANDRTIALDRLAVEMAAIAWYPHNYFRVSFGRRDQVGLVLERLNFTPAGKSIGNVANQRALRRAIRDQATDIELRSLLRYVPYRLLDPFFRERVSGTEDYTRNRSLQRHAEEEFESVRPLYRFVRPDEVPCIEIHPKWMNYLQTNQAIVEGWAEVHWLRFLQDRNPATPALSEKIKPPTQRSPLSAQTRFWDSVLSETSLPCLYSGEMLSPGQYHLDHFVPWSFVCHDRIWNLAPVSPAANAAKRNALPDKGYIPLLAEIQAEGLTVFARIHGHNSKRYIRIAEPYISDLRIAEDELSDPKALEAAYHETLEPLLTLASRSGFPSGWRLRS